jgi:hypothetical protein
VLGGKAFNGPNKKGRFMLKQPDKFLPVTTNSGFQALVSSGLNGDFRIKDMSTGEFYVNFFVTGLTFLRVSELDVFDGPRSFEKVEDKDLIRRLREAKYGYVDTYFEH